MRTIETTVTIAPDGHLSGNVPTDIDPGEHCAVLIIDEKPDQVQDKGPLTFSSYPFGLVSDSMTFRREDIYDDSGR